VTISSTSPVNPKISPAWILLNAIVEEFQKGYFLHDRILRPAMVTVATAPSDQEPEPKGDTNPEEEGEPA